MEVRRMGRKGFCRGCDKKLDKGDLIFYTYTDRNRGQHIIFCWECVTKIYNLWSKNDPLMQFLDEQWDGDDIIGHRG